MTPSTSPIIDSTTILSLASARSLLVLAYVVSQQLLPTRTPRKLRILFIWHAFDTLIHFIFEGSFLYNCFFTYTSVPHSSDFPHPASLSPPGTYFLGRKDRLYGSNYGTSPTATLWQEYAKADKRWGGADLKVISLEILTVFGAGPIALYVCELVRRGDNGGRLWFWASVLATGELYGGFMTFCPEWLTGSVNLDTGNAMYLWVYLGFFNLWWVVLPLWVLREAYTSIQLAFARASGVRRKDE